MARRRWHIGLGVEIRRAPSLRNTGTTRAKILKDALHATAKFWHERIFPGHFVPEARREYAEFVEPRTKGYIFEVKLPEGVGAGRTVADILKGKSARWMKYDAEITGTSARATVRMDAPPYFTDPFIGSIFDEKTGRTRTISRQPDKPEEVTSVSDEDRSQMQRYYSERITEGFAAVFAGRGGVQGTLF